jgi:hypothetical protein
MTLKFIFTESLRAEEIFIHTTTDFFEVSIVADDVVIFSFGNIVLRMKTKMMSKHVPPVYKYLTLKLHYFTIILLVPKKNSIHTTFEVNSHRSIGLKISLQSSCLTIGLVYAHGYGYPRDSSFCLVWVRLLKMLPNMFKVC